MKAKKIPLRKCISCGESKEKSELIRVVKTKDGALVDTTGRLNGRGAYICRSLTCYENAKESKKLNRSLGMEIKEDIYENILEEIKE